MFKGAEQPSFTGERGAGSDGSRNNHVLHGEVVLKERTPGPNSFGLDTFPALEGGLERSWGVSTEHSAEVKEPAIEAFIQEIFPGGLDEVARNQVVPLLETASRELVPENAAVDFDGGLVSKDEVAEPALVENGANTETGLVERIFGRIRKCPAAKSFLYAIAFFGAGSMQGMPEAKAGNREEIRRMYDQADDQYQLDMARHSIDGRRDELMRYQNWEKEIQMEQVNDLRDARMLSHAAVKGFEQSCKTFSMAIDRIKGDYEMAFLGLSKITDPKARTEERKRLDFATMERIVREENAFKESSMRVERDVRSTAAQFGKGEQRRAEEYIAQYKDVKTLRMLLPSVKFRLLLKKELEDMGVTFGKSVLDKEAEVWMNAHDKASGAGSLAGREGQLPDAKGRDTVEQKKAGTEKAPGSQDDAFFRALMGK